MLEKRRRDVGDRTLPRLPDTVARIVCFTILTTTRSGRTKKAEVRVLTTLLDPDAFPVSQIAAGYAERWQVETAFLHLKKTVRGAGRELRGQYPEPACQEAWALLLVHNMIAAMAAMAARAAAAAGTGIAAVSFAAVLALVRDHVTADACCSTAESAPPAPEPARAPHRSHRSPARRQGKQEVNIRKDRRRAKKMANRESHLRPHDNPVKPPTSGHKAKNLRAVSWAHRRDTRVRADYRPGRTRSLIRSGSPGCAVTGGAP
jgi:hypothetical protein